MKIFLTLIVLLTGVAPLAAQYVKKTEAEGWELRGKVKEFTETKAIYSGDRQYPVKSWEKHAYSFDRKGSTLSAASWDEMEALTRRELNSYDENNHKINSTIEYYLASGTQISEGKGVYDEAAKTLNITYFSKGAISFSEKTIYDERGQELEVYLLNADGTTSSRHSRKYDDKGNLIEYASYDGDALSRRTLYKYNAANQEIEQLNFEDNEKDYTRTVSIYNAAGKLIGETEYDKAKRISRRLAITYQPQSRIHSTRFYSQATAYGLEEIVYNNRDEITSRAEYEFACAKSINQTSPYAAGSVLLMRMLASEPPVPQCKTAKFKNLLLRQTIRYTYDANGNWTERTQMAQTDPGKAAVKITVRRRTISYYDDANAGR